MRAFAAGLSVGVLESVIASGEISGDRIGPAWREVVPIALALLFLAARSRARPQEAE